MSMRGCQFALAMCAVLLSPSAVAQWAAPERPFKVAFQLGVTEGGDNLATVYYSNGGRQDIRAGALLHFAAGVLWQPEDMPFSWQATYGYHVNEAYASNSSTRFSRFPLEVLAFYNGVGRWRFGGGVRFVNDAEFRSDIGSVSSVKFDNTTGVVAEVGYDFGRALWLSGRFVAEKYRPKSLNGAPAQGPDVNGDHVGIYFTVGF